jgi:hypothetical protein
MRTRLAVLALALIGMLLAGSIGYAAYLASRDSVGLPVTKLETQPRDLAPTVARRRTRPRPATTRTVAPPAPPPPPTPRKRKRKRKRKRRLETFAQLGERGPAGVGLFLVVRVRLGVQVLAADRA